ncbi:methyl-accepting chemotaxis protein [Caenimonas sedimenti]|uniref:Methyl-accepting chemotaxis protein n=1 Tax=Caenimonas sedimenti TaxID=2596921 RepID=A0A562ZY57_9BURK|nr:methyl-accepting chemotaxis protein [Caenimonas sedimenti]TWO73094.1 methyl-accepting chemotaxis protein [Caenimonas sedimenti]
MFQKKSVSTRLLSAFSLVIALLVVVAGLGILNLNALNKQIDQLANNRVPLLISAGNWEVALLRTARYMQTAFVLTEQGEITEQLKGIQSDRRERAALLQQVRTLATTDRLRVLLRNVEAAHKTYAEAEDEFLRFADAGHMDDAKVALLAKTRPAQVAYTEALSKLVDHVVNDSREMARESVGTYQTGIATAVAVSLLAIAAALAVAVLFANGLRKQLGGEPGFAASVVRKVAAGDLTTEVKLAAGDNRSLLFAMKEMITGLRSLTGEVARGAHSLSDTSAQIAQGNLDLSQRTEEQASTLEETASSMEELTSTVQQNAQNAREASQLATTACDVARQGSDAVEKVVTTMDDIWRASRKIADIISVIDGIAFQTNILALNAAVEAARSGEHGRGFAVVAAEVRSLAQRSAAAAKEIKGLIEDSANKVQAGGNLVDSAGHTMVEVVMTVEKVSKLIAEIAAASREQSMGIEQVTTAVGQMDRVVQQNATLVEEAAAATESMKDQAAGLLQMISRFKLGEGPANGGGGAPASYTPVTPTGKRPPAAHMPAPPELPRTHAGVLDAPRGYAR